MRLLDHVLIVTLCTVCLTLNKLNYSGLICRDSGSLILPFIVLLLLSLPLRHIFCFFNWHSPEYQNKILCFHSEFLSQSLLLSD